jgi:transposase
MKWTKKKFMIPAPILVGVELNPGPAPLTQEKRREIIWLKNRGYTNYAIAQEIDSTPKTVRRWVKRNKKKRSQKTSFKNQKGQGRKRKLTKKQERQAVKKAKNNDLDAKEIALDMSDRVPGGVNEITIRRTLKEHGLKYLVRKKRQVLTPLQVENRLKFAQKRLQDDWKYALFVDEVTFKVGCKKKSWQDPNDRKTDEVVRHPAKLHVWAGIGLHFKTKLYMFEEILKADLYCKILNDRLPPAESWGLPPHGRSKWILVQDNDPKHTSKKVKKHVRVY